MIVKINKERMEIIQCSKKKFWSCQMGWVLPDQNAQYITAQHSLSLSRVVFREEWLVRKWPKEKEYTKGVDFGKPWPLNAKKSHRRWLMGNKSQRVHTWLALATNHFIALACTELPVLRCKIKSQTSSTMNTRL